MCLSSFSVIEYLQIAFLVMQSPLSCCFFHYSVSSSCAYLIHLLFSLFSAAFVATVYYFCAMCGNCLRAKLIYSIWSAHIKLVIVIILTVVFVVVGIV